MFKNVGAKIKTIAKVFFWIGFVGAIIGGIAIMAEGMMDEAVALLLGLLVAGIGFMISWISSLFLYAFGELVEKTTAIERNTRGASDLSDTQVSANDERRKQLESLRAQNLISEEEYQQALGKQQ